MLKYQVCLAVQQLGRLNRSEKMKIFRSVE